MTHPQARQAEIEREGRRRQVASYLLSGVSDQSIIAGHLKVNRSTISRDIAVIEEQWRAEAVADIAAVKGKAVARLERLIAAHWQQALKGDPLHTSTILKATIQIARVMGLEADTNINVRHQLDHAQVEQLAAQYGLDPDEVIAEAERVLAESGKRTAG